jgi:PilZ domain
MPERRRYRRRALWRNGRISFEGVEGPVTAACVVADISPGGAQLILLTYRDIPPNFRLSVDGIVGQSCSVRWREDGAFGVAFDP